MRDIGNILIVDDNPNNLQVLGGILQEAGYKVRPALSGELALRAVDAYLPDLILLDVRMPKMDGYETCQRIKADKTKQDIPVIFISALSEIEDKLNAFRAGAVDYITKPFQAEEVLARVQSQIELSWARKELAEKNVQLHALMNQMVQSEKLRSLGSLAAGVAHELNTPVGNAMLTASAIDSMLNDFADAQAAGKSKPGIKELLTTCREGVDLIVRNLNRASKLVNSMREVSVDRASERRRKINLRDTVTDVVATMCSIIRKAQYAVTIDIDDDVILETYPGHLEHILDNLINNAIIHGYDGHSSGTIMISAKKSPKGGAALILADNGKGIAPEHIKQIFDPFFTTKLGQGGSGLGLHIVYNLATGILGGNISVSSTLGAGAEFKLTLPAVAPLSPEELESRNVKSLGEGI